jgi:hypothetical protein
MPDFAKLKALEGEVKRTLPAIWEAALANAAADPDLAKIPATLIPTIEKYAYEAASKGPGGLYRAIDSI